MTIRDDKLDFWIKNNYNVLFVGKHGVGKTSVVLQAFNRANLKWKYFSASTLDPWVDVVGIPRPKKSEDGKSEYLELVRPKEFQNDEVEALFFDEYNRSAKKIRNAVMELIQFKSINGKKFNNLKIVWAAINPDDDEQEQYDVEKLDSAQIDRFHVKIEVPYECSLDYFNTKYGKNIAKSAISWWGELSKEEKNKVSPRRLDYALDMFAKKGDLRDVLPASSNIGKLLTVLKSGPISDQLDKMLQNKATEEAKTFLTNENNYASAQKYLFTAPEKMEFFVPLLSKERLTTLLASKEKKAFDFITKNVGTIPIFKSLVTDILVAKTNRQLVTKLQQAIPAQDRQLPSVAYAAQVKGMKSWLMRQTQQRMGAYREIQTGMPKQMTLEEAVDTLEVLNTVIGHSQISTINHRLKDLGHIMNTVVASIAKHTGLVTVDAILKQYQTQIQRMRWKLDQTGITGQLKLPQPSIVPIPTITPNKKKSK